MPFIPKRTWLLFSALALLGAAIWYRYTLPQLSFIDLSVDRDQAAQIATDYLLAKTGMSVAEKDSYTRVAIFSSANHTDRFLQTCLGFKGEIDFLKQHQLELFLWDIRFFKESVKEEFLVTVSAGTGEVLGYRRLLDSSVARPEQSQEAAKQTAITFLQKKFNFKIEDYEPFSFNSKKLDNRTDHYFSWKKKDVFIPWSKTPDTGGGKLITSITVAGDEVLAFFKTNLDIPEQYHRYLDRAQNIGRNLSLIFRVMFYILLTASIFYVVVRRNDLVMQSVKNFAISLTAFIFVLHMANYFNEFQNVLFSYPTTTPMASYLWRNIITAFLDTFITVLSILMPCLAGESLHRDTFSERREGSFLHYLRSTFFSRSASQTILLGYLTAIILIGIQSLAFEFGQRYWGVQIQYSWMAQMSASYIPFLAAFILGTNAAFTEEICFRLFGINIGKKFLKNTAAACVFASVIWGYGHSGYLVFPMWFRGVEVTLMGLFLSYVYLRYGLLTVITAHYLFDVFWGASAHLLGQSSAYLFFSSILILLLPLFFALAAHILNRSNEERPLRWKLSRHQLYNLEILKDFLRNRKLLETHPREELKKEIASHGWDSAVVDIAFEDLSRSSKPV